MKINIRTRKKGYASLEVIAMSLIGFTLVLALLSIALNKRVLIENEIKTYEKRLNEDYDRNEFLEERLSLINNEEEETIENTFDILDDEKMQVSDTDENLSVLKYKEVISNNDREDLNKLNILEMKNNKFKLYLNEDKSMFILEESLDKDDIKTYYYYYKFIENNIYLEERKGINVK